MPLLVLLPPKTRSVGEWCVKNCQFDLPLQYESQKECQSERGEMSARGEDENAKKQQ